MKEKRKLSSSTGNLLMELKAPSMSNPLQQAVFRGCVECIQVLVETPPYFSVDSPCGPEGLRPIHIAAREGHINNLRYLISAGASVLKSDFHGLTALHHAAIGNQIRAVRWLLRHGAEITLDKRGRSPIQVAADNDHLEIVTLLAKHASCGGSTNLVIPAPSSCSQTHCTGTTNCIVGNPTHNRRRSSSSSPSSKTYHRLSSSTNYSPSNKTYGCYSSSATVRNSGGNNNHHQQHQHTKNSTSSHKTKTHNNNHLRNHHLTSCTSSVTNNKNDDKNDQHHNELSSSGNSSLATVSGSTTPSLSPSSATTASCSCPSSSESSTSSREESKSGAITFSDDDNYLNSGCCGSNNGKGSTPFYLHPPKSSLAQSSKSQSHNSHSTHKRHPSSASSFYLHPPSAPDLSIGTTATSSSSIGIGSASSVGTTNCTSVVHFADEDSDIEIQEASTVYGVASETTTSSSSDNNNSTIRMAPVTPNNCGAAEFIPPKSEHNGKTDSTSSSPSPPPAPKSARTHSPNCSSNSPSKIGNVSVPEASTSPPNRTVLSSRNNTRKGLAPPPPPPPPMPKFIEPATTITTLSSRSSTSTLKDLSNHPVTNGFRSTNPVNTEKNQTNGGSNNNDLYSENGEENDYEDIDEMHFQTEELSTKRMTETNARQLSRSVSAPVEPSQISFLSSNNHPNGKPVASESSDDGNSQDKLKDSQGSQVKVPSHIAIAAKMNGVVFIPPNFPDPPRDALIKPSEYLKSIQQNKSRTAYAVTNGNNHSETGSKTTTPSDSPLSKVEVAIKMLTTSTSSNHYNGSAIPTMPAVFEETNAAEDQEEINAETIDNVSKPKSDGNEKPKSNIKSGVSSNVSGGSDPITNGRHCIGIKCEEFSKVNLRKTPTSRTISAPVLGRVLPDKPGSSHYSEASNINNIKKPGEAVSTFSTAIIAELSESSQVGGVREWKEELKRRQVEMEKAATKELDQVYSPLNFVEEVPSTDPVSGVPIPPWKRQMIAKKVAEKARKEAEEQRRLEAEAKRVAAIPPWRRQLLQKRESTT